MRYPEYFEPRNYKYPRISFPLEAVLIVNLQVKVKQSLYKAGEDLRVPCSKI
jgi:hypothetical protein